MARHVHEFYCTNCDWWNYPMMSDKMDGNYEIICGHCDHVHYRVIRAGVVVDDKAQEGVKHNDSRWHKDAGKSWTGDTIHVMPSASQQERRKLGRVVQFRQMEAAGLAT